MSKRFGLRDGTWGTGSLAIIGGAIAIATASGSVMVIALGWASVAIGAGFLAWGLTIHGKHWWHSGELIVKRWIVAILLLILVMFVLGAIRSFTQKSPETSAAILFPQSVPGFSAHLIVRLADIQETRRKYLGTFTNSAGAKASLYISASDRFTVSFTDTNDESYTLETVAGRKGVPIAEWVYLAAEVGASGGSTRMQLRVNGDVVADRVLPFEVYLGKPDWRVETLGGNAKGKENGGFSLGHLVLYGVTMDEKTQGQIDEAVASEWKIKFPI